MIKHQTHLRYIGGGSDKVYSAWLRQDAGRGLFSVDYAYGKTGTTPQTGSKTPGGEPDEAKARKIYDKLVNSKTAKGYIPTEPMALPAIPQSPMSTQPVAPAEGDTGGGQS